MVRRDATQTYVIFEYFSRRFQEMHRSRGKYVSLPNLFLARIISITYNVNTSKGIGKVSSHEVHKRL